MASQIENDVTNRVVDHGFLSVFNTCLVSVVYRSQVIGVLSVFSTGALSISAARRRRKLELTSPFKSLTTFPIGVQYTFSVLNTN
jgi:hypothetical protein